MSLPSNRPLRIGLFTYSTNPRGGVVHALDLASALHGLGHDVTVTGLDESGAGFFRSVPCRTRLIPVGTPAAGIVAYARDRIDAYTRFLLSDGERFDVYHAQDTMSANALATLCESGVIPGFARTVHHLDTFADRQLDMWQDRGVNAATRTLVVSELWERLVRERYGRRSVLVRNGVDRTRFSPASDAQRAEIRRGLGFDDAPLYLSIGGIEARKNAAAVLDAFVTVREREPRAVLAIAGGASVFDHSSYRRAYAARAEAAGLRIGDAIRDLGIVSDAMVVELLRAADALVFPSLREGFGLAVIEALACGTPVVVSAIPPFTEYLTGADAVLVDPTDTAAIAAGMLFALGSGVRSIARARGPEIAGRFDWTSSARAHVSFYEEICDAGDPVRRSLAG